MLSMSEKILLCLLVVLCVSAVGRGSTPIKTDVLHYGATLDVDIKNKSVKGTVYIRVQTTSTVLTLDCGDLTIESVREKGFPVQFFVHERKLRVLTVPTSDVTEIEVRFHG